MRSALASVVFLLLSAGLMAADKRSAQVDVLFRDYTGRVPGASVIVIRAGRVALKKSYGLANLEENRRTTPKTNYRLASVSKQFTATSVLILVERGLLSLDDNVAKFFPGFPAYGREIRVRHLLNHSSGLLAYEDLLPEGSEPVLDRDVLEILKRQDKTYFPSGAQFRYSNSGYALLASIVEKVSGLSFPEFLKKNIFAPLGMHGTFLNLRDAPETARRAFGYSRKEDVWDRTDQSRTSYVLGDGGIYSSIADLQKWIAALETSRVVSAERLKEAMSFTVSAQPLAEDRRATLAEEETGYGYGWFVGRAGGRGIVWHGGSTVGFRTHILRFPAERLTVIILTNRNEGDVASLARSVAGLFLPAFH